MAYHIYINITETLTTGRREQISTTLPACLSLVVVVLPYHVTRFTMLRNYYARHSHSTSNFTDSELAEMTIDPYEETPKCESRVEFRRLPGCLTGYCAPRLTHHTDTKGIIWAVCGAIAIAMLIKLWKKVKRTR